MPALAALGVWAATAGGSAVIAGGAAAGASIYGANKASGANRSGSV